jgi:hypothetical protein
MIEPFSSYTHIQMKINKIFTTTRFKIESERFKSTFALLMSSNIGIDSLTPKEEKDFKDFEYPLKFEVLKECSVSKARLSNLELPHATLQTPQFMPVGTQGALKGVLPQQIKELNCNLILANTYHLGHRPVWYLYIIFFI